MTFEALLDKVPVNRDQIFPMYQNGTEPEEFAKVYEQQIKMFLEMMVFLISSFWVWEMMVIQPLYFRAKQS